MESEGMDRMNFEKHFLPADIKKASNEYWCSLDLLCMTMESINQGDVSKAKNKSIDLLKSLSELEKLSSKKRNEEIYESLINQLVSTGIDVQIVRRHFVDR